jgi:hypothetical protein
VNVPTVSQQPDFDERRALMMALQALVNVEVLTVIARLLDGERSLLDRQINLAMLTLVALIAAGTTIAPRWGARRAGSAPDSAQAFCSPL